VEEIDAEVISLDSEITIKPSMTSDDLREAVIEYEKKLFYEKTNFAALTGDENLRFSIPGRYDLVYNHILGHKYFLNQDKHEEIPFEEALVSWYREVYSPIVTIINNHRLCAIFPGQTRSDLYIWIVKHWDFLKRKNGSHYSLEAAAGDFSRRYGRNQGKFKRFVTALISRLTGKR
jgi:hypothetical protein